MIGLTCGTGDPNDIESESQNQLIVCVCKALRDRELERELDAGVRSVAELARRTGAGSGCGMCVSTLKEKVERRAAARGELELAAK